MTVDYGAETRVFYEIDKELAKTAEADGIAPAVCTLEWSARFTRRMGDALVIDHELRQGRVRLSKPLWIRATPAERRQTMIHEIAHIYAELEQRAAGHGPVWKRYMHMFGVLPKRCHGVDRTGLRRKQRRYALDCPGTRCEARITITQAMRTRWIKERQIRRCARCKALITYTHAEDATQQ